MAEYTNESLRLLYEGDLDEHFNAFKARFVETESADMSKRNFDIENHIKTIINDRIIVTPVTFDIDAGKHQKQIDEWVQRPVFGAGQNFWENQSKWNLDLELYGSIYLQFLNDEDDYGVNQFPVNVESIVHTEDFNADKPTSYEFTWRPYSEIKRVGSQEDKVHGAGQKVITFNEAGMVASGFEDDASRSNTTNGFWQVHQLRRFPRSDSPYGPSAVAALAGDQSSINALIMFLFHNIKWTAFPMFGPPKGMDEDQTAAWLAAYKADTNHKVYPGKLSMYALEIIQGDPKIESILKRIQAKVEHMYNKAHVPVRRDNVDLRSRKAELFSSHELREYTETTTRTRARQWEQFFGKYLALSGKVDKPEDAGIKITYPAFEIRGPEEQKITLEAVKQSLADGIISKETALKTLVRAGIYDKDLDVAEELIKAENDAVLAGNMFDEAKGEVRKEMATEEQAIKKAVQGGEQPFPPKEKEVIE